MARNGFVHGRYVWDCIMWVDYVSIFWDAIAVNAQCSVAYIYSLSPSPSSLTNPPFAHIPPNYTHTYMHTHHPHVPHPSPTTVSLPHPPKSYVAHLPHM